MSLVYIRGKKGRKVPLLMTPTMVKHLDIIILKREEFQVPRENYYIFGRPLSSEYYRGTDALKLVATNCGAKTPLNLTSTRLRKHIATVSQILNLTSNDLEQITRHMGHSEDVHKQFYRLPDTTLELAKMTKLLLQFEKGSIVPGQNLDEMIPDIDFENEGMSEQDSSDSAYSNDENNTADRIMQETINKSAPKVSKIFTNTSSRKKQKKTDTSSDSELEPESKRVRIPR